ncbi:THUMP-like domain-containing protein [Pontimonas sp.]|uniref:THUMP-like domain-containing protein n=1 Tax=Pontimonas sp. TaxID=2304492 RepID=UPI00286FBBB7|nr:SAM-dependent methyltransferase [Pontimonas sp.]MDR9434709.1 SAM-dependent methyltransferase [Pontimonas sp.]
MAIDTDILLQPDTLRLIDALTESDSSTDIVQTVSALRREGHPTERIHQALEQVRLRRRARAKFGPYAQQMLFSETGLEQASRLAVAAHHAGRFRSAGITSVADLGCGLGADSMAFAALGLRVFAVDSDRDTAALASYNLAMFDTVTVSHGDAHHSDLSEAEGLWLDPSRREGATRLSDPEEWSPSLTDAFALARSHPSGVKLAPGMDRELIPADLEAQWVSHGGDVVEVVLWSNTLARPDIRRSALVLGDTHSAELSAAEDAPDAELGPLGAYIYEPDGAVIRARLIGELARMVGGTMVAPDIAYISSDQEHHSVFAAGFAVNTILPLKTKELSTWVRQADIGVLEIKKRGVDIDPARLREQLAPKGSQSATLIITRYQGKKVAIVASRLRDTTS